MDAVLEYAKVSVTIQSYAKAHPYATSIGDSLDQKDTRYYWHPAYVSATTSITPEEVVGLTTNNDETSTLYGKFYPLKVFIPEEMYLGKLPDGFWDMCREKKMNQPTETYEAIKNKNWQENNCERKALKATATKIETKSEKADD